MQSAICQLLARESLSETACYDLFSKFKKADATQQVIILTLLASKGESISELMAAREFVLQQLPFSLSGRDDLPSNIIDLVGTGGDGMGTFNISTAASLVVASCGVYVAKHGGGRSTSLSGSADVITELGIQTYQSFSDIIKSLHQHHYAYLRASYFNDFLSAVAPLRKQLGFPTIFNALGPLVNPLAPKRQVIGVYKKDLLPIVATLLKKTGSVHALVVHAEEGLDELSVSGINHVVEVKGHDIIESIVDPRSLGFPVSALQDVIGGTPEKNAQILQAIFSGELTGAKRDIVLLNAAAGLFVADKVSTLLEGVEMARDAIVSGKTLALLHKLQKGEKA
jgi:anthranilate phosphoribosyltransferase